MTCSEVRCVRITATLLNHRVRLAHDFARGWRAIVPEHEESGPFDGEMPAVQVSDHQEQG